MTTRIFRSNLAEFSQSDSGVEFGYLARVRAWGRLALVPCPEAGFFRTQGGLCYVPVVARLLRARPDENNRDGGQGDECGRGVGDRVETAMRRKQLYAVSVQKVNRQVRRIGSNDYEKCRWREEVGEYCDRANGKQGVGDGAVRESQQGIKVWRDGKDCGKRQVERRERLACQRNRGVTSRQVRRDVTNFAR